MTQLPRTLREAGVKPEALEEVTHKAIKEAALSFNPLPVGYEDALRLLKKAY